MKIYIVRYWCNESYEIDGAYYRREDAEKRVKEVNDSDCLFDYADIEEIECC